jgi:hypothetical protein
MTNGIRRISTFGSIVVVFVFATVLSADQAANEFMNSVWRKYRTMPSSSVVINGRRFNRDGSVEEFSRHILFWSQKGGIRITTPSCIWVHEGGSVYSSNAYFPGCYLAKVVGSNSGKALAAMSEMWPGVDLPMDAHLRMANSWEEAFEEQIKQSGPEGTISVETAAWQEGVPSSLLTFQSANGDYEEKIWFDLAMGYMYGSVRRVQENTVERITGSQSLTEPTTNADKQIRFATSSREQFSSFADLSAVFTENFSIPGPSRIDEKTESNEAESTR